jgi:large subunit ribosomal protein L18e
MGIDLKAGGRKKQRSMREAKTSNVYHRLLIKLFEFLSRRGESKFAPTVLKRLNMSRINRYPMSLSRVTKNLQGKEDKIAVCVCAVVDDNRMLNMTKMTVCALRFSEVAR